MCKREHTHKSVVKSNTVGMVVTCDLAIFPSASATAKTRDLKIIFSEQKCMRGGGGKGMYVWVAGEGFVLDGCRY